jgi:DnaK suppressor protein
MEKAKSKKFRNLLLRKRKELVEQMGYIRENTFGDTMKESSGDNSAYGFHMADQGTDSQEREKAFMMAYREGRLIYHIDEALARLDEGTYGRCSECGGWIDEARLEAVPHARLCIACKSKEENGKG